MKACREYYCSQWDSDQYGGHCMIDSPTKFDCEANQILDDYSIEEVESVDQYGYTFPDCNSGDDIVKLINDGQACGLKFSVKDGKLNVEDYI